MKILDRVLDAIQGQIKEWQDEKDKLQLERDKAREKLTACNARIDELNAMLAEAKTERDAVQARNTQAAPQ